MLQGVIAELELSPLLITFQARCGRYWKFSFLQRNGIVVHICKKCVNNIHRVSWKVGRICGTEGIHVLLNNAGVAPKSTRINMVNISAGCNWKKSCWPILFRLQGNRWLLHSWPMSLDLLCWQKWGYCINILLTFNLQALLPLLGQGAQTRSQVSKVLKSWRKLLRKCQCQDQSNFQ